MRVAHGLEQLGIRDPNDCEHEMISASAPYGAATQIRRTFHACCSCGADTGCPILEDEHLGPTLGRVDAEMQAGGDDEDGGIRFALALKNRVVSAAVQALERSATAEIRAQRDLGDAREPTAHRMREPNGVKSSGKLDDLTAKFWALLPVAIAMGTLCAARCWTRRSTPGRTSTLLKTSCRRVSILSKTSCGDIGMSVALMRYEAASSCGRARGKGFSREAEGKGMVASNVQQGVP